MEVSFNWSEYNKLTCIYGFRNKINGKLYIGQTTDLAARYAGHKHKSSGLKFQRAIEKYGFSSFSLEILEKCTKEELDEREAYWIAFHNTTDDKFGYNILKHKNETPKDGWKKFHAKFPNGYRGEVHHCWGRKHTEEERRKISESNKGRLNLSVRKAVICFDEKMRFVKEYSYAGDAAEEVGCRTDTINKVCGKKKHIKIKGFFWRYKQDVLPLLV